MGTDQTIAAVVDDVERFASGQLAWLARRGSPEQRKAARLFAARLAPIAARVRRSMSPRPPAIPEMEERTL